MKLTQQEQIAITLLTNTPQIAAQLADGNQLNLNKVRRYFSRLSEDLQLAKSIREGSVEDAQIIIEKEEKKETPKKEEKKENISSKKNKKIKKEKVEDEKTASK